MEIKSIELVLENCEVIEIFPENLAFLTIEDIVKNYYLNANMVDDFLVANEISLGIKKDFIYLSNSGNSVSVFDMLLYNDITGIDINYVNGSNEYIYTKYPYYLANNTYINNEFYQRFLLTSQNNRRLLQEKIKNNSKENLKYE